MTPAPSRADFIRRTIAGAFESLKELAKHSPGEAADIYASVQSHIRSAAPMTALLDTGPIAKQEPDDSLETEIERLNSEVEAMRPTFVTAIAWREGGCTDALAIDVIRAIDALEPKEAM